MYVPAASAFTQMPGCWWSHLSCLPPAHDDRGISWLPWEGTQCLWRQGLSELCPPWVENMKSSLKSNVPKNTPHGNDAPIITLIYILLICKQALLGGCSSTQNMFLLRLFCTGIVLEEKINSPQMKKIVQNLHTLPEMFSFVLSHFELMDLKVFWAHFPALC